MNNDTLKAEMLELKFSDDELLHPITPPEYSDDATKIDPSLIAGITQGKEVGADGTIPAGDIEPGLADAEPGAEGEEGSTSGPIFKEEAPSRKGEKISYATSELISADSAINIIAWLMPLMAIMVCRFLPFDSGDDKEIRDEMKLDGADRKALQKPLERLLEETTVGTKSPLLAFLIVFIVIFGGKLLALYMKNSEGGDEEESDSYTATSTDGEGKKKRVRKYKPTGGKRGRPRKDATPGQVIPFNPMAGSTGGIGRGSMMAAIREIE